jgi:4-hydroxy-tetrahydrodipicolinate synthase
MKSPLFTGVCTALVTPFLDGKINYPMLKILLRRQIDAGIKAVVLSGTTGESATLSDEEKISLFQFSKEFVGDRLCIIAGTGSNSTKHAVELSIAAQRSGADGLLIVSPYYNKATPSGMVDHYSKIAEAAKIPIILYNVPSRTGLDMPVSVYKELSALSNIAGVKEASTDIGKILQIRAKCPKDFYIWSGNDNLTVPILSLGGKGVISVISNLFPEQMNLMTYAALDGDFDTAAALQCRMIPWTDFLGSEVNPIPIKAAMAKYGYDCGTGRLPLTELSPANQALLTELAK